MKERISLLFVAIVLSDLAMAMDVAEFANSITPILQNAKNAIVLVVSFAGLVVTFVSLKKIKDRKKNPESCKGVGLNLFLGLIMIGVGAASYAIQGNKMFKLDHKQEPKVLVEEFTLDEYVG